MKYKVSQWLIVKLLKFHGCEVEWKKDDEISEYCLYVNGNPLFYKA